MGEFAALLPLLRSITLLALILINAALLAVTISRMRRVTRQLEHVQVVDRVLTRVCKDAFIRWHQPTWHAWTQVMGSYTLKVTAVRHGWDT